jgi:MPBQ/MSBQ methyltransferase
VAELSGVLDLFLERSRLIEARDSSALALGERLRIVRHYTEAGPHYAAWSRAFNMHFGYLRRPLQIFDREAMLEEMTRQVLRRLHLDPTRGERLLDMGCGLGGPARFAVRHHPRWRVDGVTLVPWQIERARELTAAEGLQKRLRFEEQDYTATTLKGASYDGIYAIESACHDAGLEKDGFAREAARLIKRGRYLVVADGFYKGGPPRGAFLKWCAGKVCSHWALETFGEIGAFTNSLRRNGFTEIKVEEISTRIAPSVAHIPWVTARFLAKELVRSGWKLGPSGWGHLLSCVLSPILGMARWRFGYYLITAKRGGTR